MIKWSTSKTDAIDPTIAFRIDSVEPLYPKGFLDATWWMAVVEIHGTTINDLVERAYGLGHKLRIPFFYDDAARSTPAEIQHVSVYAQRAFIREANTRDNDLGVQAVTLASPVPEEQLPDGDPDSSDETIKVPADTVVVAVIDSGTAFAHDLFRLLDNTTRVHCAWIMDAEPLVPGTHGRRFEKADIDKMLDENTRAGLLDEDAFYRQAGLIDFKVPGFKPASLRRSHGTHVMGLAAGYPPAKDERSRPIICVQLPSDVVIDVTGERLVDTMEFVLDYVFHCASRFEIENDPGKRPPLVINFSFGNFAGPHDGTGKIERRLDAALAPPVPVPPNAFKRRMTLPAGNGNLSRCHAEIRFQDGFTEATLDWRVQPDDRSASYVQLWMPWRPAGEDQDLVRVTVEPPGAPESPPVGQSFGDLAKIERAGGVEIGQVTFVKDPSPTDRGVVNICIHPTASFETSIALAPSGLWKIRVTRQNIEPEEPVQVWIRRDETLPGFPLFGRQSYFDNECYQRFDERGAPLPVDPGDGCIVRRSGTLSGFACGRYPVVLGGFVKSTREAADYSAAGPITAMQDLPTPNRAGPDAAARSDDSPVAHGVLSAGSRSGSLVSMNGTSVSAPRVAFWIASELAAGQPGDRSAVWDAALADDPPGPGKPPETRVGGGRMRLPRRLGSKRP